MGSVFVKEVLIIAFLGNTPHNLRLYIMPQCMDRYILANTSSVAGSSGASQVSSTAAFLNSRCAVKFLEASKKIFSSKKLIKETYFRRGFKPLLKSS